MSIADITNGADRFCSLLSCMTEADLRPSRDLCVVVLGSLKAAFKTAAHLEKVWLQSQAGWSRFRCIWKDASLETSVALPDLQGLSQLYGQLAGHAKNLGQGLLPSLFGL